MKPYPNTHAFRRVDALGVVRFGLCLAVISLQAEPVDIAATRVLDDFSMDFYSYSEVVLWVSEKFFKQSIKP